MNQAQFNNFTDTLQRTLFADDRVRALIAIGSLARPERVDAWSDYDFWVITTTAAQIELLTDLSWLPDHPTIALALRLAEQYYTIVYTTGHIAESAIFGPHDLSRGRLSHYRMLFDKDDITARVQALAEDVRHEHEIGYNPSNTLGHFLVTLCTDAARAARGERLSAHTYIFQYAVDDLLTLITHQIAPQRPDLADPFDARRRFEQAYPDLSMTLASILALSPAAAARQLLDLAERLFPDSMIALPSQALPATRAYLQTLEQNKPNAS
jgi:hypothetical protein